MAGDDDLRQYALYPVVYLKQGFYRVVQKQRVRFYDHKLNRISDQKWVYGRNIYENVDRIVDSVFANYSNT